MYRKVSRIGEAMDIIILVNDGYNDYEFNVESSVATSLKKGDQIVVEDKIFHIENVVNRIEEGKMVLKCKKVRKRLDS